MQLLKKKRGFYSHELVEEAMFTFSQFVAQFIVFLTDSLRDVKLIVFPHTEWEAEDELVSEES